MTIADGCTIEHLCNGFMEHKAAAVEDGDLSPRTLTDYHAIVKQVSRHFGNGRVVLTLTPIDFREFRSSLAKRLNTASLHSTVNKIRVVFNYAAEAKLIPEPIDFGAEFKRPSAKRQRRARNQRGPKLFHREEIRRMMEESSIHLRAMIHLGINGGMGNSDCGRPGRQGEAVVRVARAESRRCLGEGQQAKAVADHRETIAEFLEQRSGTRSAPKPKSRRRRKSKPTRKWV